MKTVNPVAVHAPVARYVHAIEVPAGAKRLVISGQIGMRPDGGVPEDAGAQAEQAWRNLLAILEEGGYAVADLVRVRLYATRVEDLPAIRAARDRALGDHAPASTLVVVAALVRPEFLVEIEGEAVRSG